MAQLPAPAPHPRASQARRKSGARTWDPTADSGRFSCPPAASYVAAATASRAWLSAICCRQSCCAASGLGFAVSRPFGPHGRTPLAAAAYAGQGDMLRHLVTMGAKLEGPDASNLLNEGPLWDAVRGGGANLSEGGTASILRSIVGTREVNIRNTKGDTLLHWAAANGACDAIRWLAESGADLIAPNANGKVPREVATAHGQMEAELLLSRLARGQVVLPNAADWMSRRRK